MLTRIFFYPFGNCSHDFCFPLSPPTERREERVGDWRDYMHKEKVRKVKKAKKNMHVLG